MTRSRGLGRTVALLLGVIAVLLPASPASAHADLVGSTPSDGVSLPAAPKQLRIDLSESVVPSSVEITLTSGAGRLLQVGPPQIVQTADLRTGLGRITAADDTFAPTTVLVDLPSLPPDAYHVAWTTLSADDLHTTSGTIVFGVGRDISGAGGGVDDPLPPAGEVALTWVVLLGAGAAFGGVLLARLAGGEPVLRRRLLATAVAAGSVAVLAGPAQLLVQARSALDARLLGSGYGTGWLVRELSLAAVVVVAGVAWRRVAVGRVLLVCWGAFLVAFGASSVMLGHVRSGRGGPMVLLADLLHVAASTLWVGAVAGLAVVALSRTVAVGSVRALMARFGRVGAGCLAAMVVTGILLVSGGVRSLDALLMSTYGRLVIGKLLLVVLLTAVAGLAAATAHPALLPARWRGRLPGADPSGSGPLGAGPDAVGTLLAGEAALLALVLGLGVAVGATRPATGTEWVPRSTAVPLESTQVQDLVQTFTVSPNLPGSNFVTLDVFETRRPSLGEIRRVVVTAAGPAGRTAEVPVAPQGEDRWMAATDVLDTPGSWRVTVRVLRAGLPDVVSRYDWVVRDPGARLGGPLVSSHPWSSALRRAALALTVLLVLTAGGGWWHRRRRRHASGGAGGGRAPRRQERDDAPTGAGQAGRPAVVVGRPG